MRVGEDKRDVGVDRIPGFGIQRTNEGKKDSADAKNEHSPLLSFNAPGIYLLRQRNRFDHGIYDKALA